MQRLAVLILCIASAGSAGAKEPAPQAANGLAVHEWGVFQVSEDSDFANAALRAEWDDLPGFAYGYIKGRAVPQHWGAFEIRDKPIIFFHAQEPIAIRLKVDFPGGMPGVWFPATERPAVDGFEKQPKTGDSLEWNLGVKECPKRWTPKHASVPDVPDKHWVSRLRQVKSDEIFARFSPNPLDVEREKFIFYDGMFPQRRWLKIGVDKNRVSLTSQVKHPVFDITAVDRRGDAIRVARVAKLDAGETIRELQFNDAGAKDFSAEAAATLVKELVAAGLFDDEAKSLVDTWKARMFETPGLNLFYRLPQSEYDAAMPITATPNPDSMIRVGLIYHGHLETDFADRVLELVKQLDAPKFAERDAAMKKLLAIGPAALVQLERLRERTDLPLEVRERIDTLVKKWSAKEAFDQ
jgi:hypothetical protein